MTDKILIDRSVVEQALKALEKADRISGYRNNWAEVNSLIAALAQPQGEQEPVTARHRFRNPQRGTPDWSVWQPCKVEKKRPVWEIDSQGFEVEYQALYTHPQPPRQPLTDEQIEDIDGEILKQGHSESHTGMLEFARAIERAHGIGGEA